MNIALIIAGGSGERMQQSIPKQFLNVNDRPVIIHTLEAFQKHPNIDEIVVVCLDGWHEILNAYCKQFKITKLSAIISGGQNGQDSIRNGLNNIATRHTTDAIVLIHDAIRPLVSDEIISDNIRVCNLYGNAITVIPCTEAMLKTVDGFSSVGQVARDNLKRTQTPQSATLGTLLWAHEQALKLGIANSVATCTLLIELDQQLYFSMGSEKNIKLTTPDDMEIFKALLALEKTLG